MGDTSGILLYCYLMQQIARWSFSLHCVCVYVCWFISQSSHFVHDYMPAINVNIVCMLEPTHSDIHRNEDTNSWIAGVLKKQNNGYLEFSHYKSQHLSQKPENYIKK